MHPIHDALCEHIRAQAVQFFNADTADLFTGTSHDVDRRLWLVESHVAPK